MSRHAAGALVAAVGLLVVIGSAPIGPSAGGRAMAETARAEDEPSPFVGQTGEAARTYRARGARFEGPVLFVFAVVAFETAADAEAAFPAVLARIGTEPETARLSPVSEPPLGDEAVAFGGASTRDGFTVTMAALVVREDRFVHAWRVAGLAADPLPDLVAVAERVIGAADDEGTPAPGTPDPEDLGDRLPDEDDLPSGFALDEESGEPADA